MSPTNPNVYSNDEITVTYKPSACINAERCANELSNVFRQTVIPWINLDGAPTKKIVEQIKKCPSGALQCKSNKVLV
ncbi:(4Fe-4S)-binding protein [Aegicerativicinus sediminis]|uniref:(4Fe-4S)-binding protein n=1 Tax=Aegicerativicinus sediminis TaxID=2893202 RepID=UPI001E301E89|nr:(4Fe-4S)-binding protein [Aegicerativicinus sediminis]